MADYREYKFDPDEYNKALMRGVYDEPSPSPVAAIPEKPSAWRRVPDVGVTALKSAVGLAETGIGLADIPTFGAVGRGLEKVGVRPRETQEILSSWYSPQQQAAQRAVSGAFEEGFLPGMAAAIQRPSTIATTIGESVPTMLGGAGIARGILKYAPKVAPWAAGAMGEGVVGAGSAAEQIRQQSETGYLSPKQLLSVAGSGAGTAAFGAVGGKFAQRFGVGDVETALAQGAVGKSDKGFVRRLTESGFSEGVLEELPQSMQEQMWQNYALDRPLTEGLAESAGMGMLAGVGMGATAGALTRKRDLTRSAEEQEPPATETFAPATETFAPGTAMDMFSRQPRGVIAPYEAAMQDAIETSRRLETPAGQGDLFGAPGVLVKKISAKQRIEDAWMQSAPEDEPGFPAVSELSDDLAKTARRAVAALEKSPTEGVAGQKALAAFTKTRDTIYAAHQSEVVLKTTHEAFIAEGGSNARWAQLKKLPAEELPVKLLDLAGDTTSTAKTPGSAYLAAYAAHQGLTIEEAQNAIRKQSATQEIPPTGTAGQTAIEGGEGVRPGVEGQEVAAAGKAQKIAIPGPVFNEQGEIISGGRTQEELKAQLNGAAARLMGALTKGARANIVPEENVDVMRELVAMFDAAIGLGHISLKQATKYVMDTLGLGEDDLSAGLLEKAHAVAAKQRGIRAARGVKGAGEVSRKSIEEVPETMKPVVMDFMGWDENGEIDPEIDPMTFRALEAKYGEVSHVSWKKRLAAIGFTEADRQAQIDAQTAEQATEEAAPDQVVEEGTEEMPGAFTQTGELIKDDEVIEREASEAGVKKQAISTDTGLRWKTDLGKAITKWKEPHLAQASAEFLAQGEKSGVSSSLFAEINKELGRREAVRLGVADLKIAETTRAEKTAAAQALKDKESAENLEKLARGAEKQLPGQEVQNAGSMWTLLTNTPFSNLTAVQRIAYIRGYRDVASDPQVVVEQDFDLFLTNMHNSFLRKNKMEVLHADQGTEATGAQTVKEDERVIETTGAQKEIQEGARPVRPVKVEVRKRRVATKPEEPKFSEGSQDALYNRAIVLTKSAGRTSVPKVMRDFNVSKARAHDLVKQMEQDGYITSTSQVEGTYKTTDKIATANLLHSEAAGAENPVSAETLTSRLKALFRMPAAFDKIVTVYATQAEAVAKGALSEGKGRVAGWQAGNKIGLIAENIEDGQELGIFLHEVGVHLGMEKLIGKANMDWLRERVADWAKRNDGSIESEAAKSAIKRALKSTSANKEEEVIAYVVEELVNRGMNPQAVGSSPSHVWFRRLWAATKVALRKLGFKRADFSGQNLVDLAYGAASIELEGAWHGTAAVFRKFHHAYMGSGAGAQAYGWGTYLAQREGIGRDYMKQDASRKATQKIEFEGKLYDMVDDTGWRELKTALEKSYPAARFISFVSEGLAEGLSIAELKSQLERNWDKTVQEELRPVLNNPTLKDFAPESSLMRVASNVREDEFLDWDRLLGDQDKVVAALKDNGTPGFSYNVAGEDMYKALAARLGSDKAASEYLNSIGIKGIKYLDRASRGAREGTSNLVIFNDKNIVRVVTYPGGDETSPLFSEAAPRATVSQDSPSKGVWEKAGAAFDRVFNDPVTMLKEHGLGWLSMDHLVEVAQGVNDKLVEYRDVSRKMQAMSKEWVYKAAKIDAEWGALKGDVPKQLGDVMRAATRAGFDPEKGVAPISPEEQAVQAAYAKLSPAAVKVYKATRDHYAEARVERQKIAGDVLTAAHENLIKTAKESGDATKIEKAEAKLSDQLAKLDVKYKSVKGPYFPLMRLGKWYVVGMSKELAALEAIDNPSATEKNRIAMLRKSEKHYTTSSFETKSQAEAAQKILAGKYASTRLNRAEEKSHAAGVLSAAGLQDVEKYIDASFDKDIASEIRTMMAELYYEALPEHHALKREMQREGVYGEEQDMRRVFAVSTIKSAHYMSRLKHADELKGALFAIKREGEKSSDARGYYNEVVKRAKLSMDETSAPWADKAAAVSYLAHLGLNPAFVLTNASQVAMITTPWLAARTSTAKAVAALGSAYRVAGDLIVSSYEKQGWRAELDWAGKAPKGIDDMLTTLLKRNLLDITIEHDLGATAELKSHVLGDALRIGNLPVHITELANRAVTAIAAYNLAKTELKLDQAGAVEFAAKAVSATQLDYSALNAPRHMQRVFGSAAAARIVMQFRKYQQGMLWLIGRSIHNALKGATPKERLEARKTLFGLFTTTGIMAGSLGMPLAGTAMWGLTALAGLGGDDDDPWDARTAYLNWLTEMLGKDAAIAIAKGVPAWMFGIDLEKRVGLGDVASPLPFMRQGKTARDDAANALLAAAGAPVATAVDIWEGIGMLTQGDWAKGAEKAFPLMGVKNLVRGARYSMEGMTEKDGDVILPPDSFSIADIGAKLAGFATTKESVYYEATSAVKAAQQAAMETRKKLLAEFAQARMSKENVAGILAEVRAFNKRHPESGVRINASSLTSALKARRLAARQRGETGLLKSKQAKPFLGEAAFAE